MVMQQMIKAGYFDGLKIWPLFRGLELMQMTMLIIFGLLLIGLVASTIIMCSRGSFFTCISQVMFGSA